MGRIKMSTSISFFIRLQLLVLVVLVTPSFSWVGDLVKQTIQQSAAGQGPPDENIRLLILPGFGNDSNDYYLQQAPQGSLVGSLKNRGWRDDQIRVLPLQRSDWLQVFYKGIFDPQFWSSTADPTRPAFSWYLQRVADTVTEMTTEATVDGDDPDAAPSIGSSSDKKVVLLCHSAGGWLARACLGYYGNNNNMEGDGDDDEQQNCILDRERVLGLVTLGTPHVPPPADRMDMTRGALRLTHETFPGAYHNEEFFYMTVVGDAIGGVLQERQSPFERTTPEGLAYNSYDAVCGEGAVRGDGLVPLQSGHLDDAVKLDLQCFHSINAPNNWYGSDSVLDQWHDTMLAEIQNQLRRRRSPSTARGNSQQPKINNPLQALFR